MQDWQQACDWGTFEKLEVDTEYPAGPITVGMERKIWFLHPLVHQKMQFLKPGKYSIINKSTTIVPFCHLYVSLLNWSSFLHKYQKKKKTEFWWKNGKITCLLTVYKYLHQLPWVNCRIVELSQKKKEIQYQDVFYINLSFFILSLDSSAFLGNRILPDMYC